MQDRFLIRAQARLNLAQLLGTMDRWIRRSLQEMTGGQLWDLRLQMNQRVRELATLDTPGKLPSMGTRLRTWWDYPLKKYLDKEEARRYDEQAKREPALFRTPLDDLSDEELDGYIFWLRGQSPDVVDKMTTEDRMSKWRREGRRVLPILPISGSLPSNIHVRRPPNNRDRGGPSGAIAKALDAKEAQAAIRIPEEQVSIPIKTIQII